MTISLVIHRKQNRVRKFVISLCCLGVNNKVVLDLVVII
jgi:hypothetical protein